MQKTANVEINQERGPGSEWGNKVNLLFWKKKCAPMERPIDQSIREHFRLLDKWNHAQRKEIIAAILNREYPGKHLHGNPVKKPKQTEIQAS
jgi:hypothetical protein